MRASPPQLPLEPLPSSASSLSPLLSRTTTSLLDIPNEILRCTILEIQDVPSLSALSLTSFRLFENTSFALFKTVHLRHPDQVSPFLESVRAVHTIRACTISYCRPCSFCLEQRPSNRIDSSATLDLVHTLHFHASPAGSDLSYPHVRFPSLRTLHIHSSSSHPFRSDRVRLLLPPTNPIRCVWRHVEERMNRLYISLPRPFYPFSHLVFPDEG
jgi:hypothetical protein